MEDKKIVTLMVNECSEFHSLGESHENIKSVDEAIRLWKKIPTERMHGIKSIGIRVVEEDNSNDYEEMDVVVGRHMDLDMLHYYPDISENEKAIEMVKELQKKLPEIEVIGEMPGEAQVNRPRRHR